MSQLWTIDAVKLGEIRQVPAEDIHFKDRTGRRLTLPTIMFVIRSGDEVIVVDTGGPIDADRVRRLHGFDYESTTETDLHAQLGRLGIDPPAVDRVVNTHLHWDHCTNNHLFTNARIVVQRAELAYAVHPCPAHRATYEINEDASPPWTDHLHRIHAIDGRETIASGVELIPLPGHSPGSQGVRVDTATGTYIITGDCVDTYANWDNDGADLPRPSGGYTDLPAFYESLRFLKASGWTPLPSHDQLVVDRATFGYPR